MLKYFFSIILLLTNFHIAYPSGSEQLKKLPQRHHAFIGGAHSNSSNSSWRHPMIAVLMPVSSLFFASGTALLIGLPITPWMCMGGASIINVSAIFGMRLSDSFKKKK